MKDLCCKSKMDGAIDLRFQCTSVDKSSVSTLPWGHFLEQLLGVVHVTMLTPTPAVGRWPVVLRHGRYLTQAQGSCRSACAPSLLRRVRLSGMASM